MPRTVDITIAPNDKYYRVADGYADHAVESNEAEWNDWPDEHQEAADDYAAFVDEVAAVDPEDYGKDPEEIPTVSWDDISPSSDADLVAKMATYFDGMTPDEPTARLRAKLRLLDVDTYVDAQLAATAELQEGA